MPSSAAFALQFPALASGLPKDDESNTPQTDCFLQCPQCHQTLPGFQALNEHIDSVHSMIKQEHHHDSATPSPPLSAFYRQSFQPIGSLQHHHHHHQSLPSPPASTSTLENSHCNEPTSAGSLATNGGSRSSSSNSNSSSSSSSNSSHSSSSSRCSRSTPSAGGGLSLGVLGAAATTAAASIADEGGRSISPTYSNSSSIGGGSNCGVAGNGGGGVGNGNSSSNGGEPYACLQCSASFPNRDLLEKHELMHVPNALVVSSALLFYPSLHTCT